MKHYYQQSIKALQLAGMSKSTPLYYTRSVRQLVDFYNRPPNKITEKQQQDYFLHRSNQDKWSAATLRIAQSGIKFFFTNMLKHNCHTFNYLNAKRERRLPCILSREEVFRILGKVKTFQLPIPYFKDHLEPDFLNNGLIRPFKSYQSFWLEFCLSLTPWPYNLFQS